jgi:spermidine synthase
MDPREKRKPDQLSGVLGCFFLSGAAGLVYQVAWGKALGLIFGHTAYAVATVLAVFMAGLACGSVFLWRWIKTHTEPILLYSRMELLVAAAGALSLGGLACVRWLYVSAYAHVGQMGTLLLALRFFGAAVVLFVPTFLMGGTLPVLVQGVTRSRAELSQRVSQLYWVNTLGALVGTLLCGFVLLPWLGLRRTVGVAVALNIAAGVLAWWVVRSFEGEEKPRKKITATKQSLSGVATASGVSQRFLLMLFGVVGATAFAYEIAWTRLLAIEIGSSTYAFTIILATFLLGAVAGSVLFQRTFARGKQPSVTTFSWTQTWIGVAAVVSLVLFQWIPSVIPVLLRATHRSFGGLVLAQMVTSALTVLPMAVVFGFNFPAVLALLSGMEEGTGQLVAKEKNGRTAQAVGRAYAANTVGAIAGSLVTGFLLVPSLGSFRVIALTAAVNLLIAIVLKTAFRSRQTMALAANFGALGTALVVGFLPYFNNPARLSLSAALYGNTFQGRLTLNEIAATNDVVYSGEGVNDSIAVIRSDNYVALRVNGKVDASTGDTRTQLLLGHLGVALHTAPKRVLVVGFGSGMTLAAVARYPDVERIDCVEIEPAVVRASPYLESLNRGVLGDNRVNIIFDDARNFLLTTREKYDLIISEPSNPWIAGIATLFTDEFYAGARQRLAPGGMFLQWVQAYALAPQDLKMIAATLAPHFAEVTLWRGESPDLLFLGRTEAGPLTFSRLRGFWSNKGLRRDFDAMDVHEPEGLVAYFLLDDAAVRRLGEGSVRNTDDQTLLEYHAPRTLLAGGLLSQNHELIGRISTGVLPWRSTINDPKAQGELLAGMKTALDLEDVPNAQRFVEALKHGPETVDGDVGEGRLELLRGNLMEAEERQETALTLDAGSMEAMHWLARVEEKRGEKNEARNLVDKILARDPENLEALTDEMEFAADRSNYPVAALAQMARIKIMPEVGASEYCRLGAIWMKLRNLTQAEQVLGMGLQKDSYSYSCNLAISEVYRETGRTAEARESFEKLLRWYPDGDPQTYEALAELEEKMGDQDAASNTRKKRERIFGSSGAIPR